MSAQPETRRDLTELVISARKGSPDAAAELYTALYGDLRRLAAFHMKAERVGHTLQPTALVNEAFARYFHEPDVEFNDRAHFLAVASQVMRRILVDYARARHAAKRGGHAKAVTLTGLAIAIDIDENFLALDSALDKLGALDERAAKVVEMRFFGGLSEEEVAAALGISSRTVKRDWKFAQAWLYEQPGLR